MAFDGSALSSVGIGAVVAAIAITMFSVNGYDSAINFSEEARGGPGTIGKAVVIAALTGIVLELVPLFGGLMGAEDLTEYLSSATPLTDLIHQVWGPTFQNVPCIGALFAVLNAILAITLQFARILWSSARDRACGRTWSTARWAGLPGRILVAVGGNPDPRVETVLCFTSTSSPR